MRYTMLTLLSVMLLGSGGAYGKPAKETKSPDKLELRAFWVNMNGVRLNDTGTFDITIERWSTQDEVDRLQDVLVKKGGDALLSALQKTKPRVGYIRNPWSVGWDLYYARQVTDKDGGRRIYLATDRPISFWEASNQPRSIDYDFTLAEIRLDKDGKGEGKLVPAAMITYDEKTRTIEIENYQIEPVRLAEVRVFPPVNAPQK
jgi:hypothetical protein